MIQVNLFRISANQEYLEFILDCPEDYRFNKMLLKQYDYTPTSDIDSGWRDFSTIFNPVTDSSRIIARIKIVDPEHTDFTAPTLFYATLGVTYIGIDPEAEELEDVTIACSNVAWMYSKNLDLIMNTDVANITDPEYKSISRNYIYIQAHLEAMRLERFEEAERFYTLLKKLYNG